VLAQRAASEGPSLDARKGDHPSHLLKWWFAAAFPAATARPGAQGVGRVRKRTFFSTCRDWRETGLMKPIPPFAPIAHSSLASHSLLILC